MPRRAPSGPPPGDAGRTDVADGDLEPPSSDTVRSVTVECALYSGGERVGRPEELERALEEAADLDDGFAWIGLHDPSSAVVETIGERFGLHPLAVEDAVHAHQRAKLEVYDDIAVPRPQDRPLRRLRGARGDRRADGLHGPELRRHGPPRGGQPARRRPARPRVAPGPAEHRPERGAVRDRRQGGRRLRGRDRRPGGRHGADRGRRLQRRSDESGGAHLQAQAGGARVQAGGAPPAEPDAAPGLQADRPAAGSAHRRVLRRRRGPRRARRRAHPRPSTTC